MSADQTRIIARLELGMSLSEAAEAVGINSATARGWLFRGGRQPEGAHGVSPSASRRRDRTREAQRIWPSSSEPDRSGRHASTGGKCVSGNPDPGTLSRGGFHGAVSGLTPGRGAISTLSSDIARAVSPAGPPFSCKAAALSGLLLFVQSSTPEYSRSPAGRLCDTCTLACAQREGKRDGRASAEENSALLRRRR